MTPRKAIGTALLLVAAFFVFAGLLTDLTGTLVFLFELGVFVGCCTLLTYIILAVLENDWLFWRNP